MQPVTGPRRISHLGAVYMEGEYFGTGEIKKSFRTVRAFELNDRFA
jgi:hypothetical protein